MNVHVGFRQHFLIAWGNITTLVYIYNVMYVMREELHTECSIIHDMYRMLGCVESWLTIKDL